ncbi:WD repeat-containing protein 82 [Dorcoceras hygrometricum]|uniref:WD repeat-containing protein 82 n=1 Tax=Dorcoceras hygrometricum TaxID=472368 RepID=A0A2Z7BGB4_9LAMI|nr:WD repeat-containing protein 82 [Dorcoceras hygrometricum]
MWLGPDYRALGSSNGFCRVMDCISSKVARSGLPAYDVPHFPPQQVNVEGLIKNRALSTIKLDIFFGSTGSNLSSLNCHQKCRDHLAKSSLMQDIKIHCGSFLTCNKSQDSVYLIGITIYIFHLAKECRGNSFEKGLQ